MWVLSVVVIHRHHDALPKDVARHWLETLARFRLIIVEYPDLYGTTRYFNAAKEQKRNLDHFAILDKVDEGRVKELLVL